jgi:pilus assembly protein CpaB
MKKAQIIGLSVAAGAGILAFMLMNGMVQKPEAPKQVVQQEINQTEVLVASADIGVGQIVNESQFRWQSWPADNVGPGYITKASGGMAAMRDLTGSIARAPLLAGEPITRTKLIRAGQGGVLAAILPAGMRAIATNITKRASAGQLILPNDHVDVILTRRTRSTKGGEEHSSDVLFRNVRVLAIGQQIETKEGKKVADGGDTATLELTPRQAETLALANSMNGEITLSLRSIADLNNDGPSGGDDINRKRSIAVRLLRYGSKSRAYGVN